VDKLPPYVSPVVRLAQEATAGLDPRRALQNPAPVRAIAPTPGEWRLPEETRVLAFHSARSVSVPDSPNGSGKERRAAMPARSHSRRPKATLPAPGSGRLRAHPPGLEAGLTSPGAHQPLQPRRTRSRLGLSWPQVVATIRHHRSHSLRVALVLPVDRVVRTKIVPPRRRVGLLHRPRLVDFLHENLNRKVLLLSAPPGYGKTSLLVDFLQGAGLRFAWYGMDEADANPWTFLSHLAASVVEAFPEIREHLLASLTGTVAQDSAPETALQIQFKWLNRRSQRRSYTWRGFEELLAYHRVEQPRIVPWSRVRHAASGMPA
jgi:hypothetical protein